MYYFYNKALLGIFTSVVIVTDMVNKRIEGLAFTSDETSPVMD